MAKIALKMSKISKNHAKISIKIEKPAKKNQSTQKISKFLKTLSTCNSPLFAKVYRVWNLSLVHN